MESPTELQYEHCALFQEQQWSSLFNHLQLTEKGVDDSSRFWVPAACCIGRIGIFKGLLWVGGIIMLYIFINTKLI